MRILWTSTLSILFCAGCLWASTPETGAQPWDPIADGPLPSAISTTHKCVVQSIDRESRTLVVLDEGTERASRLRIDERLQVRAESKRQFDGRRRLGFDDFVVGQRLKVTMLTKDGSVARIKVLKG